MKIVRKKGSKRKGYVLEDMIEGDNVFVFSDEYTDEECDPMIAINTVELGYKRCKPNTKGLSTRKFDVEKWLKKNDFIAVVSLDTGVTTVHPKEVVVIPLNAKLIIEGKK